MDKNVKIILLIFTVAIAMAGYFFWGPKNVGQNFVDQLPISSGQETVVPDSDLVERPYDEELQKKFLVELKGKEKLPKFEDFPAIDFSDNKDIVVDINSDPIGRMFRSAIRYSVKIVGINFAGKYSIAEWGCGSTCQNGAIVNADTGHVYPLPAIMANSFDARKNSRLLIQNPIIIGGDWPRDWYRMRYWEWTGQSFKLLGVYKADLAKKEIIEVK